MNASMTLATARRVLAQLRHDPRSIALIIGVPGILLGVVYLLFDNEALPPGAPRTFDRVGPMMLAIFPFVVMFLITSITMLRERTTGTLERVLSTPINKADLLFGYALAFGVMAALQATVTTAVAYLVFGLDIEGNGALVVMVAVVNAVLGVALGLFCSAFARTEFQAVQFMPVVVVPQILLCGLFVPREQLSDWLEAVANAMPLTYTVDALQQIAAHAEATGDLWFDVAVAAGCVIVGLLLASLTLRRRSA